MSSAVRVIWTPEEIAVALDGVRASSIELGRKQALRQLERAETRLTTKGVREAGAALHFGEKPLGQVATVLNQSESPTARSALAKLEKAGLEVAKAAKAAARSARAPGGVAGAPKDATGGVGIVRAGGERKVGDSTAVHRKRRPWRG